MRRLLTILAAGLLVACAADAKPKPIKKSIALGGLTGTNDTVGVTGWIDAVYVSVSDGASTGNVQITYAPYAGSTAVNIATNMVTDEKVWRPVTDRTGIDGAALTSDEPGKFGLAGETVTFTVSGSPTNVTWTWVLVIDE